VRQVGRDLGARYVVEGSVRRAAGTVRVTAQLIDAGTGAHLWVESYEGDLTVSNIFALQDQITNQLVNVIADAYGVLARTNLRESKKKPPESLDAYDCVLRGYGYLMVYTAEAHLEARDCLERAVKIDPDYSDAWAWLTWMHQDDYLLNFNPRPDPLERALQAAQRAVDLDQMNQLAHHVLAVCHFLRSEDDLFLTHAERALAINSNNAAFIGDIGIFMVGVGEWDRGVALARKAMRLNPYHGGILYEVFFKYHYSRGEYEEALNALQKINMGGIGKHWLWFAAVYGQLGRREEATEAIRKAREIDPVIVSDPWAELSKDMHVEEWVEHLIDGLRKAGLDVPPRPA
jgi:tetratricopeptide (TPR) repeat protein